MKALVVFSLSAAVLAGCGDPTPASAEKPPAQAAFPETAKEPDGTASRPFELGVFAPSSDGSRWDVTLTETVVSGGSVQILAENPNNEVRDGWDYVLGRMTSVVNENLPDSDTGEPVSPSGSVMPVFIGSDGRVYDIWNDDNSAVVLEEDWIGQSDIIARTGIETTGRFAIQVPNSAIAGGQFATRNQVEGNVVYFGDPVG